eukprot:651556-Rhodomonas_salina.2
MSRTEVLLGEGGGAAAVEEETERLKVSFRTLGQYRTCCMLDSMAVPGMLYAIHHASTPGTRHPVYYTGCQYRTSCIAYPKPVPDILYGMQYASTGHPGARY